MAEKVYAMRAGKMIPFGILGMPGCEDYILQRMEGKLVAIGMRPPETSEVVRTTEESKPSHAKYAESYADGIRSLLRDTTDEHRTPAYHVDAQWWAERLAQVEPA